MCTFTFSGSKKKMIFKKWKLSELFDMLSAS